VQDHAEATGHSNFEESKEKVVFVKCEECGKMCRSAVEQEMHGRATGHSKFVETSSEGVDTEAEMNQSRHERDLGNGGEENTAEEMIRPEVDSTALEQLAAMGFSENKAIRALHFSGNSGIDAAIEWISEHESDKDLEEPLLVPAVKQKPKLTPEEARAQAEALILKAKKKREAEEREMERLREQERIRGGKELAALARKEEEQKLKRIAEERQREKEEEARAREKIRKKLEQDRMERRVAMGLPPELTEEEKEEERRRQTEKAEREAKRRLPVKPHEKIESMRNLLVALKKANAADEAAVSKAYQTLLKLISNVYAHPDNPKYRKINLANQAVIDRVGRFQEALDFLHLCGFAESASESKTLELLDDALDKTLLQSAIENLDSAISNPFFGVL
jgi:hypothetical protein